MVKTLFKSWNSALGPDTSPQSCESFLSRRSDSEWIMENFRSQKLCSICSTSDNVLFSDNFRKSFQKLKFPRIKNLVIRYIVKLSSGWRPKKVNVDRKCENSSYVLKLFKVDMYYIVCSIDIAKDTIYKQVLKVWDILPMNETAKYFKRLDSIFSMYTDNFIKLCNEKLFDRYLEVPKSWSFSKDIIRFKNPNDSKLSTGASASSVDCRIYVENSNVNESLLLMKFYSLSIGAVNHLLSDLEGRELDLPFEVTDEEREIINFPRSSFILGRSGTGKTTILTMKLFKRLNQYCLASRDSVAADSNVDGDLYVGESMQTTLHQLFVTVSPKLCYAVKNHVSQLKSFATENFSGSDSITGMDDVDEMAGFKDIPDTFLGIEPEKYPLIITFHKFLMMLDSSLGNSYFQRFHEVRDTSNYESRRSIALQTFMRKKEVTYDRFRALYWPHFNSKVTKNLDSSRVFTEIMSHIKGGVQDGDTCDSKRSRQAYISLSDSSVSTLSEETRDVIYDIFEDYEKLKLERGDFDLSDFVNDIHLRIKNEDLLGDKMDFVYIDEVQDLSMRQISLFRYICKNVDEGFVFSGDTAQTIARGIDFRFEDIRSLFYTNFLVKSWNSDISGRREKGLISDMFNLSQNFRTHTGVLRLAQSVIDLICHYFPQSIDSLPPETSLIYGESPVVLQPGSDENMIMSIFGQGRKSREKWVGFGADQVILVRDDSARKEISSYVGQQALVLTILECKGLEFQDVLLYNFFGSSPLCNSWRVVYEFLKEKDLLDGDSSMSFLRFSHSRHNILCSELKQLYVAITRTRQRLWICENNVELSKPMFDYWTRLCHVQETKIDDSLAAAMQRASSPEEWKSQGIKLFREKNYEMAIMCFEKAGDEMWEKRAKASGLRAAADGLRSSNPEDANANILLREAAEIFDSIDRVESATGCFCDLGDYERAGRIYLEKCGMSELTRAGECFCLAGNYKTAAEVYAKGNFFRECLSACTKGSCYDLGLQYVEYWKEQASFNSAIMARFMDINKIAQVFLEKCAMEYYNAKDNASLMKFVRAFSSTESKRSFLKSLDYIEGLLLLEEESGNFSEAAEIAKSLGDTLREVDLLEKAKQFANACLLILSYVLSNSLWMTGNRGWPLKSDPQKVALLNRAMCISQKVSEAFHVSTCAEVKTLLCEQSSMSELMLCYSSSKQYGTPVGEILSVRKLMDAHFQINTPKSELDPVLHLDPKSFEERISRNRASGGTLFYLWNLWKSHCSNILECLDNLERSDFIKPEGTVRFCLNYFGVRLPNDFSVTFHLMNPDAAWVRNVDKGFMRQKRNVTTLEARHFASAARKYWHQEFVSVGLRVLEALQGLYKSLTLKRLSKYCQSICLLQIFDIAKFLLESKSINMNGFEARKLQDSLQLSTNYIEFAFPLDSRESMSENMITLRETLLSKNLLEEIVSRNISKKGELTYGQIGRSVMIMLGNIELKHGAYDGIVDHSKDTSWKSFVKNLRGILESYSSKESESNIPLRRFDEALSRELHKALEETYNVHWREFDYISPHCFFYLVERLLILAPHSQGYFFTSKSSFIEHLMCLPADSNARASIVTDTQCFSTTIFDFVVRVVQECLSDSLVTAEWIKTSRIDCEYYFPVLLLRLFVILCLSCLNSGSPFSVIFDLLIPQITAQLPRKFYEALQTRGWSDNSCVSAVADAFKAIGDRLVIVASNDNTREVAYPDAIFLELRSFTSRNETMEALFSRCTEESSTNATTSVSKGKSSETGKGALQVEVEEHVNFLANAVAKSTEQWSHNLSLGDVTSMIDEFNTISSLSGASDANVKTLFKIEKQLKCLEERRPHLDALLNLLSAHSSRGNEDRTTNDSKVEDAESTRGKKKTNERKGSRKR